MGDLLINTLNREALLRGGGYELESMWETTQMYNTYVGDDLENFRDPLDPTEALFGGRVDCYQMFFKSFEGSKLAANPNVKGLLKKCCARYVDVTLLYPFVNKTCTYLMGHPVIKRNVDFVETLPLPYYGLMHCLALPGQNLFYHFSRQNPPLQTVAEETENASSLLRYRFGFIRNRRRRGRPTHW